MENSKLKSRSQSQISLKHSKSRFRHFSRLAIPKKKDLSLPPSNYETTFELTGYGLFSHLTIVSSSFILLHAFVETIGIAYIITPAECDLGLTLFEKGVVNAATFVGIIVTAICWGSASDRYGRRTIMMPAVFGAVLFSFASSLCTSFALLLFFRLLTGILISASSATVLVYLGELNISDQRDRAIAIAIAAVAAAFCVVPGIAWGIIPGKWSFDMFGLKIKPWRVFMWTWGVYGLIGGIILVILPESPRFILSKRGADFTLPVLAKMYSWNHKKSKRDFPVTAIRCSSIILQSGDTSLKAAFRLMVDLMRPPLRRPVLLTHYCMFNVYILANGLYIWLPDIINEILNDINRPESICTTVVKKYGSAEKKPPSNITTNETGCEDLAINTMMYPLAIGMEVFFLIYFIIISHFINKYDKRILNAAVMIPCALGLALCSVIPQLTVAGILLGIGVASGSAASLLTALAVDVFPTSLRALAMCTMFMCGQLGGAVGANLLGICLLGLCEVVFFFIAFNILVSVYLLYRFWPDTLVLRTEMEAKGMTY